MRVWRLLLGGMTLWLAHFLALYIVASVWGSGGTARLLVAILTLVALVAGATILRGALRSRPQASDDTGQWARGTAIVLAAMALLAIGWQSLPALIG